MLNLRQAIKRCNLYSCIKEKEIAVVRTIRISQDLQLISLTRKEFIGSNEGSRIVE